MGGSGGGHGVRRGVMVEQIFSKKISFRKKTAERVAGVLAHIFHPTTRG